MRILVTNDDSINSPGLRVLVEEAKKLGEVFVVAPAKEQSGKSHSINIRGGLKLDKIDMGFGVPTYSFDSTPADCIRACLHLLKLDVDLVFSGINDGMNLGEDIFYSGTVAGASEGVFAGIPGIAFSTYPKNFQVVKDHFSEIIKYFDDNKLLDKGNLYNINVPYNPKGIELTFQGRTHFDTTFILEGELHHASGNHQYEKDLDNLGSDVWAIVNEYISITPLLIDRTDYSLLKKLKK